MVIPNNYKYSQNSQELANYLPEDAKARYDRYSVFQQLVNPFAERIDKYNDFIGKVIRNNFPSTADLRELSKLYSITLPSTYSFPTTVLEDGQMVYIPPTITGYIGTTPQVIVPSANNTLINFYYHQIPTRLAILDSKEYEALEEDLQTIEASVDLEYTFVEPSRVYVVLDSCNTFYKQLQDDYALVVCHLIGRSDIYKAQEEFFICYRNGFYSTTKTWSAISKIEFFNLPTGFTGQFDIRLVPDINSIIADSKVFANLEKTTSLYWKLDSDSAGGYLQSYIDLSNTLMQYLVSPEQDVVREFELLDVNGASIAPVDFATLPGEDYIYVIDNTNLYIYDKYEDYPDLKELKICSPNPSVVIELECAETRRPQEITFRVAQAVLDKKVAAYRFKIKKPDDTYEDITSWIQVSTTTSKYSSNYYTYTADMSGDYYLILNVRYQTGATDTDCKLIRNLTKTALAQFATPLNTDTTNTQLFFDFDQQLKLITSDDIIKTLHLAKDNVLIDYDNKILYFNENYTKVTIDD